jgi:hypothetical protein
MANTYKLISSNVLSTSAASITFSSIPSTYTDLVIKTSTRSSAAGGVFMQLNGDTSSLYSTTRLRGSGSGGTVNSGRTTSAANLYFGLDVYSTSTANTFTSQEIYIPNYTIAKNKAISNFLVQENNLAGTDTNIDIQAGLYGSTTAITSVTILKTSDNFVSGSSFYLYGISNT